VREDESGGGKGASVEGREGARKGYFYALQIEGRRRIMNAIAWDDRQSSVTSGIDVYG
jgi:hypothetical protein